MITAVLLSYRYVHILRGRNFRDFCDRHENFFRRELEFLADEELRKSSMLPSSRRSINSTQSCRLYTSQKHQAKCGKFFYVVFILSFRHCNCEWARQFSNSDQHALGSLLPSILRTLKCTLSSSKISVNCRACGPSHDRPRENFFRCTLHRWLTSSTC